MAMQCAALHLSAAPAAVRAPRGGRRFARTPGPLRRLPPSHAAPDSSSDWYQPNASSSDDLLGLFRERRQAAAAGPAKEQQQQQQRQQQQQQAWRQAPAPADSAPRLGTVHLVGTGPGDPMLLTLRAVQLMQSVDVVLYDRLVSEDILRLVHPGALMVYVGKQKGFHTRTQEEIHDLLLAFAGQGASVLRLKGGDPYVFGRGGEEVQYLEARGVAVRVVPGITAASGISAELGIPLTHRALATSVRFLTGHSREGGESDLDDTVSACADPHTTLVVYMGLGTLPALAARLAAAGLRAGTPAVAVERGTTPEQRAVYATLGELQAEVAAARLASPTLIIIGQVVALAPGWARTRACGASLDAPPTGSSSGGGGSNSGGSGGQRFDSGQAVRLAQSAGGR